MRILISALAVLAITACEPTYVVPSSASGASLPATAAPAANRTVAQGTALLFQVAQRVEPIAESACQQETGRGGDFCDFHIQVEAGDQPNAYQSYANGRPILTFNHAMLRTIRNENEVAFILSHEAGHHIAGHLQRKQQQTGLGALAGALIVAGLGGDPQAGSDLGGAFGGRAYSQNFELEADVLGTYIAERAGYDPVDGAASFARFAGSSSLLATHPPGTQRYSTVVATARLIAAQRAQGITPTIPRN
ncbi:Peptidase family M48 [Monaibacterium marinum]|uniref:Peptidase family M48 n=1 Tax=Pontivivens marinum TaxID=1690039 RepID=A0A2C9CNT0_9RHOB|nr:M48 family metalloprotease [Monaibacterium marinum]SOH92867.1 Peptidase family M48 [Monaibacterium marinum]